MQALFRVSNTSYSASDFIVSHCNKEAYDSLITNHGKTSYSNTVLTGEAGSGKTHLANMWAKKVGAIQLQITDSPQDLLRKFEYIFIDGIEDSATTQEKSLLHAINLAKEIGNKILFIGCRLPDFQLPDLSSRMRSFNQLNIKKPDLELMQAVLMKLFSDRQLKVKPQVALYIAARCSRNFLVLKRIVEQIDQFSLQEKRNITISMVKQCFNSASI